MPVFIPPVALISHTRNNNGSSLLCLEKSSCLCVDVTGWESRAISHRSRHVPYFRLLHRVEYRLFYYQFALQVSSHWQGRKHCSGDQETATSFHSSAFSIHNVFFIILILSIFTLPLFGNFRGISVEETCCHPNFCEKPSDNADVKKSNNNNDNNNRI